MSGLSLSMVKHPRITTLSNIKFYSQCLEGNFPIKEEDVDKIIIIEQKLKDLAEKYNPKELYRRDNI